MILKIKDKKKSEQLISLSLEYAWSGDGINLVATDSSGMTANVLHISKEGTLFRYAAINAEIKDFKTDSWGRIKMRPKKRWVS